MMIAEQSSVTKVPKIGTSLLFKKNCAVKQVLKAGTGSSQTTFTALYLKNVIHRFMDIFSIDLVLAA